MKICLVGPTHPFRGGISHYTTLLYRHLRKKHDTQFIAFSRQYPKWLFPGKTDIDPSRFHIRESGVYQILDSMNPVSWIRSAIKIVKFKPELVIIPWWVSFWTPQFWTISLIIKRYSNARLIFLCHNVVEHESTGLDKLFTKFVLSRGNGFIVHSDEDFSNLLGILPGARIQKTFHPTYEVFNMNNYDPRKVRSQYYISGNLILFFGFVRSYKGLKYLIQAMPDILKVHDATLMVVGEFWKDKTDYLSIIRSLDLENKVLILDEYVPNEQVGNYFSAADLIVQPYTSATGSGVVQTAFAFHKPVVATRVGCLPEVIEHGRTGFLVAPKSAEKIADAVIGYFSSDQKKGFQENIKRQNYRFSWDRMVNVIESFK